MKKITMLCAALALAGAVCFGSAMLAEATHAQYNECPNPAMHKYPFEGMFFSTANVVDRFYYGETEMTSDNAYYVVYDDIDAGCDNEVIRVDLDTYQTILRYSESGESVCGKLVAGRPNESVIYSLVIELDNE